MLYFVTLEVTSVLPAGTTERLVASGNLRHVARMRVFETHLSLEKLHPLKRSISPNVDEINKQTM